MKILNAFAVLALAALNSEAATTPVPKAETVSSSAAVSKTATPVSVFTMPQNPKQGRDPFFPNSTRLAATMQPTNAPSETTDLNLALTLQGISGQTGRRLAIINGRTLAENEAVDIAVGSMRVNVRCIEIRADSVVIEAANVRRELRLRKVN